MLALEWFKKKRQYYWWQQYFALYYMYFSSRELKRLFWFLWSKLRNSLHVHVNDYGCCKCGKAVVWNKNYLLWQWSKSVLKLESTHGHLNAEYKVNSCDLAIYGLMEWKRTALSFIDTFAFLLFLVLLFLFFFFSVVWFFPFSLNTGKVLLKHEERLCLRNSLAKLEIT